MEENSYPDLEKTCRLCLRNMNEPEVVDIFPPNRGSDTDGNSSLQLSIPMRIMACAALEVQAGDGLPKSICTECRYQLEKSYYFRKRSQQSDSKLRKHIRLLNLGKKSRVFVMTEDDDFEDELEFGDSIKFIQKKEEEKQGEEIARWEQKVQNGIDQKMLLAKNEWIDQCKSDLKEEVRIELRSSVIAVVKEELRAEMEQEIRSALHKECTEQAKKELRAEVTEECRERERTELLNDLQTFLNQKKFENTSSRGCTEVFQKVKARKEHSQDESEEQLQSVTKRDTSVSPSHEVIVYDDEACTKAEAEAEGGEEEESEFYLIESINGHEDEGSVTSEKPTRKRQKIENSQRFEYFEDKMGSANFRLTASESSSHEPGAESYHNSGEVQYYKKISKIDNEEVHEIENEEGVIVLNFDEDVEGEQVESVDFADLKKLYIMKSSKPEQSANEENKTEDKPLFTKEKIVTDGSNTVDFSNNTDFPVHLRKTDTPKTFKCFSCPMVFSTSNAMDRHLRTHVKGEQSGVSYQCSVCLVYLSCKSALNRHMIIHTGEKPHVCEECGKSFVQREVLKRHMLTHTGARPFKCTHCRRTFTQKNNLINHVNRAHSEVPTAQQYSCHLCPKRFSHTSGLSRHLVTHTGLTFQCTECKRKFADRSSVKRHIVNVHGIGKNVAIESVKKSEVEFYSVEGGEVIEGEENGSEFLMG